MTSLELSALLGNYGEFIGAIAVVATLVYLSSQIRANTRSMRSQALLQSSVQYQQLLLEPVRVPRLQSAIERQRKGEALEPGETLALASWCNAMLNLLVSTYQQVGMGAFGTGPEYEALRTVTRSFLETARPASLGDSEGLDPFQRAELERHLSMLQEATAEAQGGRPLVVSKQSSTAATASVD